MDWAVTLPAIQGLISFCIAVAAFYYSRKKDTHEASSQATEVIVELRTLRRDVGELKSDVVAMRTEWKNDHDVLIGLSREIRAMWKIVDKLQGKAKKSSDEEG